MKMYADLYGNIQNYRIKSLQDNKVMAEIADEELNGIIPKSNKPISQDFQDIGYYKDEKGYTRFGIIPKKMQQTVFAIWDNYDGKNLTSNPNYR